MKEMDLKKSLTVEFKSDRTKISDDVIVEAVVAMANTDGGDIYLGVEDDGQITGLHKDHLDPIRLAAFVANKTVPSIPVRTEVQVLEGTTVVLNESYVLPLLAVFERINSHIDVRNKEIEMEIGLFRVPIPDIDKSAFREALVNAFCHRDYSLLGRIIIRLDDEGLTTSNPRGFVEGISLNNLLDTEPHGRNPALADVLKRIGLAERTGRGIDRIFEGSLLYGRALPDYSASNDRSVRFFISKGVPDRGWLIAINSNSSVKVVTPIMFLEQRTPNVRV